MELKRSEVQQPEKAREKHKARGKHVFWRQSKEHTISFMIMLGNANTQWTCRSGISTQCELLVILSCVHTPERKHIADAKTYRMKRNASELEHDSV
eukprot:1161512-Pelagomonas_calceolata.AAC.1